jgi:hypothetical protein
MLESPCPWHRGKQLGQAMKKKKKKKKKKKSAKITNEIQELLKIHEPSTETKSATMTTTDFMTAPAGRGASIALCSARTSLVKKKIQSQFS